MSASDDDGRKEIKLAFLPLLGMGHLVPALEFAKQLIRFQNSQQTSVRFTATILAVPSLFPFPEVSSYLSATEEDSKSSSDSALSFHRLPPFDMSVFATANSPLSVLVDFLKPHVRSAIAATPVTALIIDMFYTDVIDSVDDLGVDCYVFFSSSVSMLGLMMYMPTIATQLPSPAEKDISELARDDVYFPGFSNALPLMAWPEPFLDRSKDGRHLWLQHYGERYREFKGIIVNSFLELQPHSIKAMEEGLYIPDQYRNPPVYPVGPLLSIKTSTDKKQQHECIQWLDGQPPKSVVFLCFGSLGSLSIEQVNEIAVGLERSGHRFLWIVRSHPSGRRERSPMPTIDAVLEQVFPGGGGGFLERTEGRGMVWPKFAPQTEILGHTAVGGFVTHCGWNSIIESLWFGVPMLTLPLLSEQHFNAFELVVEMKIALELKVDRMAGNWVTAEEVEKGVRHLMEEGEGLDGCRELTKKMSQIAKTTLTEGGSSFLTMKRLTQAIMGSI